MNQSILKIFSFILMARCFSASLYSQSNLWVKPVSATGLKSVMLVEDNESNLFVAGYFTDSLQLDSQTLVAGLGSFTAFIAKYNETQQLMDYRLMYTDYEFERPLVRHLEIDPLGQVYLTGNFYQGLYDSMGDTLLFTLTSLDEFVVKFDNNLERQWIHQFGGSNNTDIINSVELTESNDLVVAGSMSRTFDFDLSENTFSISGNNSGSPFLAKYNTELELQWARVLQSISNEGVLAATTATDGSIYSVSSLSDSILVPTQTDTLYSTSLGEVDLIINKWSDSGDILWTQLIQGMGRETVYSLEIDDSDNLYLFGQSNSPDLKIGDQTLTQKTGNDLFLIKISPEGNFLWLNQIGASGLDNQRKLLAFTEGIAITGQYSTDLSLNSRNEVVDINITAGEDFIALYNLEGELLSVHSISNRNLPQKTDLRVNQKNQIIAAAYLSLNTNFNPLPSGTFIPLPGTNIALAKFCLPVSSNLTPDTTCLDGQLILSANPAANGTNFYLPGQNALILNQARLEIPDSITSIVTISFDENQCPTYQVIDSLQQLCSVTPTLDFNNDLDFQIFPNPFSRYLKLNWDKSITLQAIQCFNQLGQMVVAKTSFENQTEIELDFDNLPEGFYQMVVHTTSGVFIRKLIKS